MSLLADGFDVELLERFVDDPVDFFDWSLTSMLTVPRRNLEAWQLAGLQLRFQQLRDRIGVLKKLADGQRITTVNDLDDVVPLLFEHTIYKSYPQSLIRDNRWDMITKWLDKLTTHDLTGCDVSGCSGIDDWIMAMEGQSPLLIGTSSGTTGTVSFIPWSKAEVDGWGKQFPVTLFQDVGDPPPAQRNPNVHVIYPYYRSGSTMQLRSNENYLKYLAGGDESRFHAAVPERLSADLSALAGRVLAAKASGAPEVDMAPETLERLRQYQHDQQSMPERIAAFLETVITDLRGERVFLGGPWSVLLPLAKSALAAGHHHVFDPRSCVVSGGGAKGLVPPADWEQTLAEFAGVDRIRKGYGMSEIAGVHPLCRHGSYHVLPWVIAYVLNPDDGLPLPRNGTVTGRAAYVDLTARSRWGGIVTGDEITMHWDDPCPCGASAPFIEDSISRYSEQHGGDDKITCAAQPEAHAAAIDYLQTR